MPNINVVELHAKIQQLEKENQLLRKLLSSVRTDNGSDVGILMYANKVGLVSNIRGAPWSVSVGNEWVDANSFEEAYKLIINR